MNIDSIAKYRNYLLPLMDCISIVLGYYLVSVLITDSFLMQPTSAITRNEIIISIVLAIIVFQVIFRLSKRYANIIRYESNQDYILYIVLSLISSLIVSLIEDYPLCPPVRCGTQGNKIHLRKPEETADNRRRIFSQ